MWLCLHGWRSDCILGHYYSRTYLIGIVSTFWGTSDLRRASSGLLFCSLAVGWQLRTRTMSEKVHVSTTTSQGQHMRHPRPTHTHTYGPQEGEKGIESAGQPFAIEG